MVIPPANYNDQLLRQTRMHHVQLSGMADLKANMLLTMASLVITLTVPRVLEGRYTQSLVVLVLTCLATIILAAYATMPKTPLVIDHSKRPDTKSTAFNILFFGDFSFLAYEEFEEEMASVMADADTAYRSQIKEIYTLGIFL
ncbi:MAG: Pycsar system effector family protein, partial [Gemmatimonadales bacterium]